MTYRLNGFLTGEREEFRLHMARGFCGADVRATIEVLRSSFGMEEYLGIPLPAQQRLGVLRCEQLQCCQ
ncbi:MAG: hypothetical protein ACK55I_34045 [bacterium]